MTEWVAGCATLDQPQTWDAQSLNRLLIQGRETANPTGAREQLGLPPLRAVCENTTWSATSSTMG